MKRNYAAIVIAILLVITAIAWIAAKSNDMWVSLCIMLLCVFLMLDSVVDYWRRKPRGKRVVCQLSLTLLGCSGVIIYLICKLYQ